MRIPAFALITLALVGLAGCAESTEPITEAVVDDALVDDNSTVVPTLLFTADVVNGTAPLLVNFTIDALNVTDAVNATWVLDIGGNLTSGSGIPAVVNHTFAAGNHSVGLEAILDGASTTASLNLTVAEVPAEAPRELPEVTHFEFADSLGCAGDALQIAGANCFSAMEGPDASGIDGYWQELGEAYWGLALDSTVDNGLGDSDCFFTDADFNAIGEGNNGGDVCKATIPEGTAWLFIYSYAEPALGMTVDVSLP